MFLRDLVGDTIAIGSQNGSMYLFRVNRDGFTCKKSSKIRGMQPLMQLDWSTDNNFIQTTTGDHDLAYCEYMNTNLFLSYNIRDQAQRKQPKDLMVLLIAPSDLGP